MLLQYKTKHAVAKFPKPKQTLRANDSNAQRFLYYAGGFGESAALDHTSPTKRGGYWLGTAPYKQHESVTSTATRHEPLEFQRRCPNLGERVSHCTNDCQAGAGKQPAGRDYSGPADTAMLTLGALIGCTCRSQGPYPGGREAAGPDGPQHPARHAQPAGLTTACSRVAHQLPVSASMCKGGRRCFHSSTQSTQSCGLLH